MPYKPLKVDHFENGLVQDREDFILSPDSFPELENAYLFRERIQRKRGTSFVGRLRRCLTAQSLTAAPASGQTYTENIKAKLSLEANSSFEPGTVEITIGTLITAIDDGTGGFTKTGGSETLDTALSTINYFTMVITIEISTGVYNSDAVTADLCYYPTLPVMGICLRDVPAINDEQSIIFDTTYAYQWDGTNFSELVTGDNSTWNGALPAADSNFIWCTNYWNAGIGAVPNLLFWTTNFSGPTGDPIKYFDGTDWKLFGGNVATATDRTGRLDSTANYLNQSLILIPYRSRLLALNTYEGATLSASNHFQNRIRWTQIGNPITIDSIDSVDGMGTEGSWRSDVRGKGGFLDLPTNQAIVAAGFVRDNLIIQCERSTWKLRFNGQAISPFVEERVNDELGVESTFSMINFDTSVVGIGDKGIIKCDSFKADRIDIKIPDLVYQINNADEGVRRVHGLRDFKQRLAYWIWPEQGQVGKFPNKRLVYNYENESWAIFQDSFTTLGYFQSQSGQTWAQTKDTWSEAVYSWAQGRAKLVPEPLAGNQKGYVSRIDSRYITNDQSLPIEVITGFATTSVELTIVNHNLSEGQIIHISGIIGTNFDALNDSNYRVIVLDIDNIRILAFDDIRKIFNSPKIIATGTYDGLGQIKIRDNINILTKKFNHIDEGKTTVFGYMDILTNKTSNGAFTMDVYVDYDESQAANQISQNVVVGNPSETDKFFNTVIPTSVTNVEPSGTSKTWQRVFCNTRGRFITLRFLLSPEQMNGIEQESEIEIDAFVLWLRAGGTLGF